MENQSESSIDALAFAKQFIVCPKSFKPAGLSHWVVQVLNGNYSIYTHPHLTVNKASRTGLTVLGLGIFLNPEKPQLSSAGILTDLLAHSSNFNELELATDIIGGRWILIAIAGDEIRVYPDATGQKTIYLCVNKGTFACSHPALLQELNITSRDEELVRAFERGNNSASWPINVVPYDHVTQVLPNHYLNLIEAKVVRYWPRGALECTTTNVAANAMLPILRGLVLSALHRGHCAMNLTGGYDSRLLLASATSVRDKIDFFTVKRLRTSNHDISISKQIARNFGLNHVVVDLAADERSAPTVNSELMRALNRNVGGMCYDPSLGSTQALQHFLGAKLYLPGLISEVNRCYYYDDGKSAANVSGRELASRAGFRDNSIAEEGFSSWLDELPAHLPLNVLDLLYWEHRLGVWAASHLTFREAVVHEIPPMNCRRFLEIGLGTSVEDRKAPYALIRELISLAEPKLMNYKFNYDWVDEWHYFRLYRLPLPWRMKRLLGWVG